MEQFYQSLGEINSHIENIKKSIEAISQLEDKVENKEKMEVYFPDGVWSNIMSFIPKPKPKKFEAGQFYRYSFHNNAKMYDRFYKVISVSKNFVTYGSVICRYDGNSDIFIFEFLTSSGRNYHTDPIRIMKFTDENGFEYTKKTHTENINMKDIEKCDRDDVIEYFRNTVNNLPESEEFEFDNRF